MHHFNKNTEKVLYIAFNALIFALMTIFILRSDKYIATTFVGIKLWAVSVLPSLLPFFFLTTLLTVTGSVSRWIKIFTPTSKFLYNCNGVGVYLQIMSFLSGYPVGAKLIADLYENRVITRFDAEKYSTFTSTSGPLFIVGSIAIGMFGSKKIGLILLFSHLLSSVLNGIVFRKMRDNGLIGGLISQKSYDSVLYESVYSAVVSVLVVGGFIAIFFTLSEILSDFKLLLPVEKLSSLFFDENVAKGISAGLIECTKGALLLSKVGTTPTTVTAVEALISFGGLSVWCQSIAYLKKANVRLKFFILSKITQTVISVMICLLLIAVFGL